MYDLIPRREGRRKELKEKWAEWRQNLSWVMREEGVYVESFQADEPLESECMRQESRVRARRGTVDRLKG